MTKAGDILFKASQKGCVCVATKKYIFLLLRITSNCNGIKAHHRRYKITGIVGPIVCLVGIKVAGMCLYLVYGI